MGRQAWLNRFVLGRSSSSIPDWQYYLDTGRYIQLSDDEINSPETTYKWVDPNPPDKVYKCIDVDNLECYGHTYDEKGHPYSKAARAQSYFQGAAETAIVLAALERAKRAAAEEQNREDVEETNEAQHRAATIEETEGGQEKLRDCVSWAVKICMKNAVMLTPMVNQTVVFKSCGDMGVTQHFLWSVRAHGFLAPFASGMLESLALASKQPAALLYPFEVLVGKLFGRQWVPMVEKSVTWALRLVMLPIYSLLTLGLLPPTWLLQPHILRTLRKTLTANPRTFAAICGLQALIIEYGNPLVHHYLVSPLTRLFSPTEDIDDNTKEGNKEAQLGRTIHSAFAYSAAFTLANAGFFAITWPLRAWNLRITASAYLRASITMMNTTPGSAIPHALSDVYAPPLYGLLYRGEAVGTCLGGAGLLLRYFGKVAALMLLRAPGEVCCLASWRLF